MRGKRSLKCDNDNDVSPKKEDIASEYSVVATVTPEFSHKGDKLYLKSTPLERVQSILTPQGDVQDAS